MQHQLTTRQLLILSAPIHTLLVGGVVVRETHVGESGISKSVEEGTGYSHCSAPLK